MASPYNVNLNARGSLSGNKAINSWFMCGECTPAFANQHTSYIENRCKVHRDHLTSGGGSSILTIKLQFRQFVRTLTLYYPKCRDARHCYAEFVIRGNAYNMGLHVDKDLTVIADMYRCTLFGTLSSILGSGCDIRWFRISLVKKNCSRLDGAGRCLLAEFKCK